MLIVGKLERIVMRNKSNLIGLFALIFILSVQIPFKVFSQDKLTANTPLIEVNGKVIKLGSAIIAFTKIRKSNLEIDEKTIFSQIIQQLVNEELLSQNLKKENGLTQLSIDHETRSAKAAQMVSKILKNFPPENLVKTIYEDIKKSALNDLEYNASHILLKSEDEAKEVLKKLNGNNFEEIAKKNSIGPSKKNGGRLDWFDLNKMVPEFSTAVMVLEEGKVSQPVKTKFGWHIIKLNKTRAKKPPEFNEISSQIANQLRQKKLNEYLETLSKNSDINFVGKNINPNEITNLRLLEKIDE